MINWLPNWMGDFLAIAFCVYISIAILILFLSVIFEKSRECERNREVNMDC